MSAIEGAIVIGGTPAEPVAGMTAWYDAADTGTLTIVSNRVSQWDDKSGNGHHLTQATSGDRPAYDAAPRTINGIVCPEFTASTEYMESTCPVDDRTCSVVALCLTDVFSDQLFGSSAGGGLGLRLGAAGGIRALKDGTAFLADFNSGMGVLTPDVVALRLNATELKLRRLGNRNQTVSESSTFTASTTLRLGADQSLTVPWDGLVGEFIVYPTELSDDDIEASILYLAGKWLL